MWLFAKHEKSYDWKDELIRLWERLVPQVGQADTLQGELVRIVGNLIDQAYRVGNKNWNTKHEIMWLFVAEKLTSSDCFTDDVKDEIKKRVAEIIKYQKCPSFADDNPYHYITEKVVDFCMLNKELIPFDPSQS